jgi:VIT1/CCC1 family predicted Fe2+/Mn2+ transporter
VVGALLPMLAILLPPTGWRVPVTFVSVVLALMLTGWVSATIGDADRGRAMRRNVIGGALAMVVTYGVGMLVGGMGV